MNNTKKLNTVCIYGTGGIGGFFSGKIAHTCNHDLKLDYDHFFVATRIILTAGLYVGTHIQWPGVIYQSGRNGKILFGTDPQNEWFDLQLVTDFLSVYSAIQDRLSAD
ncbi:MAG: hypothetical protein RQ739_16330 [Desulfotignum sp.]|nr:hypothetical protein [Desulfotignum sp.]